MVRYAGEIRVGKGDPSERSGAEALEFAIATSGAHRLHRSCLSCRSREVATVCAFRQELWFVLPSTVFSPHLPWRKILGRNGSTANL